MSWMKGYCWFALSILANMDCRTAYAQTRARSTILQGPQAAAPQYARPSDRVGTGEGGALEGVIFSPVGPDNTRTYVVACPVIGSGCNSNAALIAELPGALYVSYRFEALVPGAYFVMAWRDIVPDQRQGPDDFVGAFSLDGRQATVVYPPARGVNVRLKDPRRQDLSAQTGNLGALVGSWREVRRSSYQAAVASLSISSSGDYERSAAGSFSLGACDGQIVRTEQGVLVLAAGKLRFEQRTASLASGGSCLRDQRGPAAAAANPEFYYEFLVDEIGRASLILRQASGKDVIELQFVH